MIVIASLATTSSFARGGGGGHGGGHGGHSGHVSSHFENGHSGHGEKSKIKGAPVMQKETNSTKSKSYSSSLWSWFKRKA